MNEIKGNVGGKGFRELRIWQKSKDLAVEIYKITNNNKFQKDFGLRDQIRRSAVSIASNIAEGDERDTNKEAVRFFHIAKGSLAELSTQLQIASEIDYIDKMIFSDLDCRLCELGKMIGSIIKVRQKTKSIGNW
jgi:four helix bundle protein